MLHSSKLRPHLTSRESLWFEQINQLQRPEGYLGCWARLKGCGEPVAGWFSPFAYPRLGNVLYVDDLVTRTDFRAKGHARL